MRASTALTAFLAFVVAGCEPAPGVEVARAPSPSGAVEAVLFESNGGATTSFGYGVFVVEAGAQVEGPPTATLYAAVRSDSAYGVNLRWEDDRTLALVYLSARHTGSAVRSSSPRGPPIRVIFRDGIEDPEAPAGGMAFNLRRPR